MTLRVVGLKSESGFHRLFHKYVERFTNGSPNVTVRRSMKSERFAKFTCLATLQYASLFAQTGAGDKLAPYYPTPATIVEKMLDLGGLKAGEHMFDLGSGDGRIVIMAAQKYGADSAGVELDSDLVAASQQKIRQLGLKNARIIYGDILKQDYSSANL